jgi:aryl sulfotransferase
MKILQSGVPKSGNYWLYTILRNIIDKSNISFSSFIKEKDIYEIAKHWELSQHNQAEVDVLDINPDQLVNRISQIYRMPVTNFDDFLNKTTITWTHSIYNKKCINIYSQFDKIVYIIRDPRAVVLSEAKFQNKEYSKKFLGSPGIEPQDYINNRLEFLIRKWSNNILSFMEVSREVDVYPIFYENLKRDTFSEIKDLVNYLGLNIEEDQVADIVKHVSLESMKQDNPKHVRKGKLYEWKNELNDVQKWKVDFIAGPIFNGINYPKRNDSYPSKIVFENFKQGKINKLRKWIHFATLLTGGYKLLRNKF